MYLVLLILLQLPLNNKHGPAYSFHLKCISSTPHLSITIRLLVHLPLRLLHRMWTLLQPAEIPLRLFSFFRISSFFTPSYLDSRLGQVSAYTPSEGIRRALSPVLLITAPSFACALIIILNLCTHVIVDVFLVLVSSFLTNVLYFTHALPTLFFSCVFYRFLTSNTSFPPILLLGLSSWISAIFPCVLLFSCFY